MMLGYLDRRNLFGNLVNNTATAVLSLADTLINIEEKRIMASYSFPFLEKQFIVSTIATPTFTVTIATPAVFTSTAHGLQANDIVYFATTGALPTGLTAGTAYYVIATGLTANAFEVSTSIGGTAVNTSGTQSGTHTITNLGQFVTLPQYVDKVASVYVRVGTYNYAPRECPSRSTWDRLNLTTVSSDIPQWWYVYDGKLGLYPKPSTSGNIITVNAEIIPKDLTITDYTTGGILTTVLGSATVTGTGTTWTASMAGRWLKITESDTANKGDGYWYQILSVASATSLTLVRPYAGTAITTGNAAYSISQCSILPEPYQDLPIYGACRTYFTSVNPEPTRAQLYENLFQTTYKSLQGAYSLKNQSCVIDDGEGNFMLNPNNFISLN